VPTLRISHSGSQVEATLVGEGLTEKRPFSFTLSAQDAEDIRWYLEDYRIYPVEPTPKTARRIEQRMSGIGRELFQLVLAGSDVWQAVRNRLADTRIEVETELEDALVPWDLLRDPVADLPLALNVDSFVRCHSSAALRPNPPAPGTGKIRILLAICRLEDDRVAFRSVARHLIRGLTGEAREPFQLEVLRPPTFEQLAKRLRAAKALALANAGRLTDAREWAQAALRDFQACENVELEVVKTLKILERIESGLRATSPPS